ETQVLTGVTVLARVEGFEGSGHFLEPVVRWRFLDNDRRNAGVEPQGYKICTDNCPDLRLGYVSRVATCASLL
ncbi:hypothetical protein HAX54_033173, partial [Datura stramonium]|nr:hypothetical protein [Datura stramonium]